jgi:tetratricopeptide (TPR) repeat protein
VALFPRKKSTDADPMADAPFRPQPDKARTWFDYAENQMKSAQYATAIIYYACGIALDPSSMVGHEGTMAAANRHLQKKGKRLNRADLKELGKHPEVAAFAEAEALWMSDLLNGSLAIKTLEACGTAEQEEAGLFLAPRVLNIVSKWKKVSKSHYIAVKDACAEIGAWNDAITAGQLAMELDPSDGQLDADIKGLSAQRAMSQGGYESALDEDGSFRGMVKDMDKQRELEEEESIAGVGGGSDRVLKRARATFRENPNVPENILRLGKLLRRQGDIDSLKEAEGVYMNGYKATKEYRFRMTAGDILLQRKRQEVKLKREDGDEAAAASMEKQILEFEATEYAERSERYPTDRQIRYHLGEVALRTGDIETAMGCFQKSKDEPRLRCRAGHLLGRCFSEEGWHAESIAEYRDVLANIDATEGSLELEVRYDLMLSLIESARLESSEVLAREALEICSGIARQDITYRDIRSRRHEIDELVRSL